MSSKIQISCLGKMGRFGNQLFQYAFARSYAERYGCVFEAPKWIGNKLFGLNDPLITHKLPQMCCDHIPWGKKNIDLNGYFQYQDCVKYLSKKKLREWFNFLPEWRSKYPKKKPFYIACHLRRGDYCTIHSIHYAIIQKESYIEAVKKYGYSIDDILWVDEENPEIDNSVSQEELGFLPDFFTLMQSDILFRANSTFSWWASVLGDAQIYSPLVGNKTGKCKVDFVKGNWPKMCDGKNVGGKVTDLNLRE